MHESLLKCKCDAIHEYLGSFKHNPTQKFRQNFINFEKPQKFSRKTKNRGLSMKCMKNEGLRTLTNEQELDLGRKSLGNEVWSEREVFGKVRSQKGSREIEKNEMEITLTLYIEILNSQWIERCVLSSY